MATKIFGRTAVKAVGENRGKYGSAHFGIGRIFTAAEQEAVTNLMEAAKAKGIGGVDVKKAFLEYIASEEPALYEATKKLEALWTTVKVEDVINHIDEELKAEGIDLGL